MGHVFFQMNSKTSAKLMAMSFNELKPTFRAAIDKIIWNLRSNKQPSSWCTPISKHFNISPNTLRNFLVSHAIDLDKGKSTMSKGRAKDSGKQQHRGRIPTWNYTRHRGYESDPTDKTEQIVTRAPLSNPFNQGGNWYRKTVNKREGQPYFKPVGGKPISDA